MTASPSIRLCNVRKLYPGTEHPAVEDLSLDVPRGAVVALIGPSGCGKTTTLRMINRLVEPSGGVIEVEGRNTRTIDPIHLRRSIGYVMQSVGLFPHRTVADNIGLVPRALRWDSGRIERRTHELAELVGLETEQLARYPDELSGGQQQRVGVARALAADPPILLMDEPFGAVDPVVRARLQHELLDLQLRVNKTIVLVTHDLDEALTLADQVALLDRGGRLAQYADPDTMLQRPSEPFVAEFLGADRSIRRLSLKRVASIPLADQPVIELGRHQEDARELLRSSGGEWLGVVSDGVFRGWLAAGALDGTGTIQDSDLEAPAALVSSSDSLYSAMDCIMTARTGCAVVVDDGVFRGFVTLDMLRRALAERSP